MRTRLTFAALSLCAGLGLPISRAAAPATPQGSITTRYFLNIGGTAVADLTNNAAFPNSPGLVRYEPYFEAWAGGDIATPAGNDVRNNYGVQMAGYFYPATSGAHTFYISADDNASLFLSPDDDPAKKRLIAIEPVWNNPRDYQTPGANPTGRNTDAPENSSATYAGSQWGSTTINLEAGKPYYIEALMKEGTGGDNLSVSIDGSQPIPGDRLSPFAPSATAAIIAQPQNAAVLAGARATFSVGLDLPPGTTLTSIQWQRNGVDIPDSNTADLSVTAAAADNAATYKAIVTTSAGTLTSNEATLTVATLANEFTPGVVKFEAYRDISGTAVTDLTGNEKFTAATPDEVRLLSAVDSPSNYGDNYGAKISGFVTPPESGSYNFFLRSDDASELWLSPSTNEADAVLIAEETGCCDAFKEPDDSVAPNFETSAPQQLQAGQRYAFYVLVKEGGGGDYVQVAARKAGETTPAAASLRPLSGSWIGANAKPSLGDPQITTQPVALPRLIEGRSGVLTVQGVVNPTAYNFPVSVQWQKNGQDITGETSSTLVLRDATAAQSGTYRAILTAPSGKTVTSAEVSVAVVPDTFPPEIAKAGSVLRGTNTVELGIGFDEPVDEATASAAANYTLSKGTVTNVRFEEHANPTDAGALVDTYHGAVLETSGLASGDTVTITVKNVKDLKGNTIPAAGVTKDVTVTSKMTWVSVGGNDYQQGATPTAWDQEPANFYDNVVALGTDKDFDLISGGSANWNNYDEATYVYEKVSGDFDRVARVEYQDPSSQWARAGIMVRKTLDADVTRAQVDGGYAMSQTMIVRVNPTVQWSGAAGNNAWEWVWRDTDGGNYSSSGGQSSVPYPNAWMRIQRSGQSFTGYASSDGITWVNIGTHSFPGDAPLPNDLFVGPYFAPELTNNDSWKIGHSVVAKFRDYGPFTTGGGPGPGPGANISAVKVANGRIAIAFTGGKLQVATKLGPDADWTDVAGAASPYETSTTAGAGQFYRVVSP